MNNLKIKKRFMALALANTFALTGLSNVTSYAEQKNEETIDITEFEDIRDIVVAKDERVAIKDRMGSGYSLLGILEPGEYLKLITDCENNYEVLYKGQLAYVNKEYVYESTLDDYITNEIISNTVVADKLTDIKEGPGANYNTLGILKEKESLKVNGEKDGFFEVEYKDGYAYVDMNDVTFKNGFIKSGYLINDCKLYDSSALTNEITDVKSLEFVKIFSEENGNYYVEVNGITGYIEKSNIELLNDKYIVVDISDQIVEMYNNNELLLSTSVVTGKPSKHSTPTGVYYIGDEKNEVTDHRDLVGDGYRSRVTYMMTFIGKRGIGFHDSEIGIDDRGVHHGWRVDSEYGGDTYITDGSHGCVNMPNDAAKEMYDIVYPYVVEQGNLVKVLVKE